MVCMPAVFCVNWAWEAKTGSTDDPARVSAPAPNCRRVNLMERPLVGELKSIEFDIPSDVPQLHTPPLQCREVRPLLPSDRFTDTVSQDEVGLGSAVLRQRLPILIQDLDLEPAPGARVYVDLQM